MSSAPRPSVTLTRQLVSSSSPHTAHLTLLATVRTHRDVAADVVLLLEECRVPMGSGTVFHTMQLWASGRHHAMTNAAAALSATCKAVHRYPSVEQICASPTGLRRRLVASEVLAAEAALLTFVAFHMPPCPMWALTHSLITCLGQVDPTPLAAAWVIVILSSEPRDQLSEGMTRSKEGFVEGCMGVLSVVMDVPPHHVAAMACAAPWGVAGTQRAAVAAAQAIRIHSDKKFLPQ